MATETQLNPIETGTDYLDVRDIIERVEYLESTIPPSDESDGLDNAEREELATLTGLLDDLAGNGGDHEWKGVWYPVTLIREGEFVNYAEELLRDIGDLPRDVPWYIAIDWEETAENIKADYSEVDFDGTTYLFR